MQSDELSPQAPYSLIRDIDLWPWSVLPPYYLMSSLNVLLTLPSLNCLLRGKYTKTDR